MNDKKYYMTERQMRILRTQFALMAEMPNNVLFGASIGFRILEDIEAQEIASEMAKGHMYDKWEGESC